MASIYQGINAPQKNEFKNISQNNSIKADGFVKPMQLRSSQSLFSVTSIQIGNKSIEVNGLAMVYLKAKLDALRIKVIFGVALLFSLVLD